MNNDRNKMVKYNDNNKMIKYIDNNKKITNIMIITKIIINK